MACPICTKHTDPKYKPFCSRRCADIDLGRWMGEQYRVPGSQSTLPSDDGVSDEESGY